MQAAEQVMEIAEANRARDHAEKAAIGAGDAPAEHDGIGAAMQHRRADVQASVGLVAMYPKIFFVAAFGSYRVKRRGVDRQSPVRVQHLDRAEILRGGGMIEQDQMPDRFADVLDLRYHHVAPHPAPRPAATADITPLHT